ncbi:MAG: tetratricopeptide repeat protein [Deltaproteobacteria bacterium]|jgi:tetratricopeptide (TPR) repeat protein|nr:tetratricopeptide repeat protein [Deltaproteobacteria bacterium]
MLYSIIFLLFLNPGTKSDNYKQKYTKLLLEKGDNARRKGETAKAVTIFESAKVLSTKNKQIYNRLADLYYSSGRNQPALEHYEYLFSNYCESGCSTGCFTKVKCSQFKITVNRLKKLSEEENRVPLAAKAVKLAKQLYKKALKLKKKKKYKESKDLFNVAIKLNPDYVGIYRQLGDIYDKLNIPEQADEFYLWYLKTRPAGKNARKVRKKLSKKARKSLGKVNLKASYKCYVAIGSQMLRTSRGRPYKTPVKSIKLPPGTYPIGFICRKHNIARRFFVKIKPGEKKTISFNYGTLSVKLKPWARVYIAPKTGSRKGKYMDAGLFKVIGIPEGEYKLKLVSHDKKKTMIKNIKIKNRKHIRITRWK